MSTDRAPKKILKDKRSKLEKILDKVSGMGITRSELAKAIKGMNRGNPGEAGASTTKKTMGPIARKPKKEIPVVDPMRYGGMVKKKKKKKKKK
jgi:hypothetical protein